jgi:3-oxoacyl-[acyl-carrier protein] reductase
MDAVLAAHAGARWVECDLADTRSIENATLQILDRGTPAALINCAGLVERASVEGLSLDSYERQMNTNLRGAVWMVRGLLPAMRHAGTGRIVNVGSISATLGTADQAIYNASKWALTGFTKSLAEELTGSGLMTVIVHPGAADTDMLRGSGFAPRMSADEVAKTLVHYALDAPLAHNGGVIEMFGT